MMASEDFASIRFRIKDYSLYYDGTIYDGYNAFLVIRNEKGKSETFQIAYTEAQREPMGKISGAIALRKGKNIVTLVIKTFDGKEVCRKKCLPV